jgi:hypothetical protein
MFAQGERCFFCKAPLARVDASVEHLVASANGGTNADDHCVACCKTMNRLLGSMSVKQKFEVVLNQNGKFRCPNGNGKQEPSGDHVALVLEDLQRRGGARPKTVRTLSGTIRALLKNGITETDLARILAELQASGRVIIENQKVSYAL